METDFNEAKTPVGLIAVYRSKEDAEQLRDELGGRGVKPESVHLGEGSDASRAAVAEMQEETGKGLILPQAGVAFPKEATKTTLLLGIPITVACTLLALPFAAKDFGGLPLWARLVVVALVGATLGGTIASIVGPALGLKRPSEPLAAERGVVLRVATWSPEVEELLAESGPIRLDRIQPSGAYEVVATEDRTAGRGVVDELRRNTAVPEQETRGDTPPRPDPDTGAAT